MNCLMPEYKYKGGSELDYRFKLDLYGLSNEAKAKVVSNFVSSVLSLIGDNIIVYAWNLIQTLSILFQSSTQRVCHISSLLLKVENSMV